MHKESENSMIALKYPLPDGFLNEETRRDYTISSKMKQVWAVQLDLLQELLNVCDRHGLRIFADSGTLIGAVREKGFIPWDDDIDMTMLREDYDKLMELADEFKEPFFLQTMFTDEHYKGHAQLRMSGTLALKKGEKKHKYHDGISIDIFVLDAWPNNPRAFKHHYKAIAKSKLRFKVVHKLTDKLPSALYRWCRNKTQVLSDKVLFNKHEDLLRSVPMDGRTNVGSLVCIRMSSPIKTLDCYDQTLYMLFEHIQIPVPVGYDELLRTEYGDYMKPVHAPTHHGTMVFSLTEDL